MYPSDFAYEEPVLLDTTLLAALVLIALGLAIAAFFIGREAERRAIADSGADAAVRIHKRIAEAAAAAAKASRPDVERAARALSDVIHGQLGPVLTLTNGMAGPLSALDDALEGRGEAGHDDHGGHAEPAAAPQVAIYNPDKVVVRQPAADHGHGGHGAHGHGHGHGHHRTLTQDERIAAIRSAIDDIADHWADERRCIGELRDARRALSGVRGSRGTVPRLSKG